MVKAILACDDFGGVSRAGTMPWPKNPKDLGWFKKNTTGHTVVMGSTTWEDPFMPGPLPNRTNILVTTREGDYLGAHKYIQGNSALFGHSKTTIFAMAKIYPRKVFAGGWL